MKDHVYFLLENVALPAGEKDAFFALSKAEGIGDAGPYPHTYTQARERLDGEAVIFRGIFGDDLNVGKVVSLLAQVHSGNTQVLPDPGNEYGYAAEIKTTPPGSVVLCRVIFFGGISASYEDSHAAVMQYMRDNQLEWVGEV